MVRILYIPIYIVCCFELSSGSGMARVTPCHVIHNVREEGSKRRKDRVHVEPQATREGRERARRPEGNWENAPLAQGSSKGGGGEKTQVFSQGSSQGGPTDAEARPPRHKEFRAEELGEWSMEAR